MEHQRNPNITYDTFKVGEHCGKLGYDAAAKIREDLWMLARAYGFADEESDRITRMNVLLNHIDYAHKQWNRAQSALDAGGDASGEMPSVVRKDISDYPPVHKGMVPDKIAAQVLKVGRIEWGQTDEKPDIDHVLDFQNTLLLTRSHFMIEGNQAINGLYLEGTEIVVAHTGISPNSGNNAQVIVGLWNYVHDLLSEALTQPSTTGAGE